MSAVADVPVFILDPRQPVGLELRRLLLGLVGWAERVVQSGDPVFGVHEARKACKRARALLRLGRADLGAKATGTLRRRIAEAARLLGPVRDAHVAAMRATPADPGAAAPGPAEGLPEDVARRIEDFAAAMAAVQAPIGALSWGRVGVPGVIAGVRRNLRRARRARRAALRQRRAHRRVEAFHTWRKRCKALWYHLDLLQPAWPAALAPLVFHADALQDTLGEHHDLAVLVSPGADGRAANLAALERRAEALAGPLLAGRPRHFTAWLQALLLHAAEASPEGLAVLAPGPAGALAPVPSTRDTGGIRR